MMAKKGRGSNTHGHGTHKRGAGRRGGRGFAGVKDARWMSTLKGGKLLAGKGKRGKYGHFGKYGFTRGKQKKPATVNLSWVDINFDKEADLTAAGVEKLLGSGKITKKLKIKVAAWTKKAEAKVKAAGGEIVQ
jgi:large subunit ribosomal protein L15